MLTLWVKGGKQIATCIITQTITQKDDSYSAEMTLQKTRGVHSRVAQGSACRLWRWTHTTEGRAQPLDRNTSKQKTLRKRTQQGLSGKLSDLKRVANWWRHKALCRDVSFHISTIHLAKGPLIYWGPCLGSSAGERISPHHCGSVWGWSWCCIVNADTQQKFCPTALPVLTGTQLVAAASSSFKTWHPTVLLSFACITPTKVGMYLLKTTQKIFNRTSDRINLYLILWLGLWSPFFHKGDRLMYSFFYPPLDSASPEHECDGLAGSDHLQEKDEG